MRKKSRAKNAKGEMIETVFIERSSGKLMPGGVVSVGFQPPDEKDYIPIGSVMVYDPNEPHDHKVYRPEEMDQFRKLYRGLPMEVVKEIYREVHSHGD